MNIKCWTVVVDMPQIYIAIKLIVVLLFVLNTYADEIPRGHGDILGKHRDSEGHVDILTELPTPQEFWDKYASIRRPVVFRGPGLKFPASTLWTDKYLTETFGDLEVKLEHKYEKGKTPIGTRGVGRDTIAGFIDNYKTEAKYIVSQLPDQMTKDVLVMPFLTCGTFYERILEANLWLSSGGTKSMLHRDADNAINCLLNGTKDWILIDPKHEKNIPIAEGDSGYGGFAVLDVNKVNLIKYPKFKEVPWWHANMTPGDCLYLPYGHWHQVRSYGEKNLATTTLFARLTSFNGDDCKAKKLKYTPLNDTNMIWTYPGHGPQTLGNLDPFELRGMLLDEFGKRKKMTPKQFSRMHPAVAEGGSTSDWKEAAMELGTKIVEILDTDQKGYVVKEDINKATVTQLKDVANSMDPDPANTEDYELYLFNPEEVHQLIKSRYDENNHVLTRESLINGYMKFGGSKVKGEELFSLLQGDSELTELSIDLVEKRIPKVLKLFSKRQKDDPSGSYYAEELKSDKSMMSQDIENGNDNDDDDDDNGLEENDRDEGKDEL